MLRSFRSRRLLRTLWICATSCAALAFLPGVAHADTLLQCGRNVAWKAANGKYVSAELHYPGAAYGLLRARADSVGAWERFTFCTWKDRNGAQYWTMRSEANGMWVSAELGYEGGFNGALRARAWAIGPWEKFTFYGTPSRNGGYAFYSMANGGMTSAELHYGGPWSGMLRARAGSNAINAWEAFSLVP